MHHPATWPTRIVHVAIQNAGVVVQNFSHKDAQLHKSLHHSLFSPSLDSMSSSSSPKELDWLKTEEEELLPLLLLLQLSISSGIGQVLESSGLLKLEFVVVGVKLICEVGVDKDSKGNRDEHSKLNDSDSFSLVLSIGLSKGWQSFLSALSC